ncbi:MAG TPA: hypothetical protein PLS50_07860, partial [Candidatus Dojkabacteria bacterium]|nr:hypothetical protein [Candidatus Dojkabacteria bacterium]
GTYALPTTKAFDTLPYETAATYGGSIFKLVDGKWQMLSQRYHYNMREWNSKENIIRNLLTIFGDPSNTLRPSEMNKVHPNFTPTGKYFTIIIKY